MAHVLDFLDQYEDKKTDPLSFLDKSGKGDPLSFLDDWKEDEDPLSFLPKTDIYTQFTPEEKTPEQIKAMSIQERMQYAKELNDLTELRKSVGFTKGVASGLTLTGSEYIPGLKPEENDLMFGLGEMIGTTSYVFLGNLAFVKPLVNLALKSPYIKNGLAALARMTGFGVTGATIKASKDVVQGEIPSPKELIEEAGTWAALDGALQLVGLSVAFKDSVQRIAEQEGVTSKEVLSRLWEAVKYKFKSPITPDQILEPQAEAIFDEAIQAEKKGLPKETEIDITPEPEKPKAIEYEEKKLIEHKPQEKILEKNTPEITHPKPESLTEPSINTEVPESQEIKPESKMTEPMQEGKEAVEKIETIKEVKIEQPKEEVKSEKPKKLTTGELKLEKLKKEKKILSDFILIQEKRLSVIDPDMLERVQLKVYNLEKEIKKLEEKIWKREQNKNKTITPEDKITNEIKKLENQQKKLVKELSELDRENFPDRNKRKEITDKIDDLSQKIYSLQEKLRNISAPLKSTEETRQQTVRKQPIAGKKQAVARSKIINLFRKAFKDPLRIGKFRQRAQGIHKMWPRVSRLLRANDVETAAHEIGHNLHTLLYGGDAVTPYKQRLNVIDALKPFLGELKKLGHYEPYTLEGFAEFTRLYVTNPEAAMDLAPNFYAKFEADLDAQYPELKNALLEARNYYDQYLQGTPESRIRAQTSYGDDKGELVSLIG